MHRQQDRAPDALDLWFARQLRLWWKAWRLVVFTVAGILVLHLVYEIADLFLLGRWQVATPHFNAKGWEYYWLVASSYLKFNATPGLTWIYNSLGCFSVAHLMWLLLEYPDELRVAVAEQELFLRAMGYARRTGYLFLGLCFILPWVATEVVSVIFTSSYHLFGPIPASGWVNYAVNAAPLLAKVLTQVMAGVELAWFFTLRQRKSWLITAIVSFSPFILSVLYYKGVLALEIYYYSSTNEFISGQERLLWYSLVVLLIAIGVIAWNNARRLAPMH